MHVSSKEYQEHPIFNKLEIYKDFYDSLSYSVMSFFTMGTKAIMNIDTHVYTSMSGTLESIRILLQNGRINDAFALQRKFHDSLIMNVYVNLYLSENHSLENFIVQKIQDWLQGKEALPSFREMTNYIKDCKKTAELYLLVNRDDRYSRIRNRGNDNTHYNFYRNVMLNDNKVYNKQRLDYLKTMQWDIEELIIMHLCYIFYLNNHYMAASDYMDYLDMGEAPPEDSQYWVSKFTHEIYHDLIGPRRPDLAQYIKDNTCMHI